MAHRAVLTARQRAALFDLPIDEMALLRHYTLDDEDIEHIRTRRRPENQIGFALHTWARIASLIETCKLNNVEPYAYLKATLEAIAAGHPAARIDELMPWHFDKQA